MNDYDYQGKRKEQVEFSYMMCFISIIGFVVLMLVGSIMSLV